MPAPLIEFPADDPDRARRFWHGVLGVTLAPRPAAAGSGWQTDTDGLRLGVHERGPGPGDTATPAIGGPCAGTPRAARSRWPPRLHPVSSTGTIAARAKR
jgi:catechol 2,3-dioxygenase-like lactoylglutathione lyase family enzyme